MTRLLRPATLYFALILLALAAPRAGAAADEAETRRVNASLGIFPRIVAVDTNIANKVDIEGVLHLALVYVSDESFALDQLAKLTQAVPNIAGRPVHAHALPLSDLAQWYNVPLGGLFITEKISDKQLSDLLAEAKRNHLVVFSPFAGDVERGAMAGISVGSQIKPYFNTRSLREAKVQINPILLRMSKQYE